MKVLFFAKTSELISFYEIMTLFDLWLFCCFWIKTFYYCVWLNNVLSNHFKWPNRFTLNIYSLTSLCIFSILFSIHSQRCWQGEFVSQSNTSYVAGCFLGNCEEELPKKPVGRLLVNCRPTVGRLSADSRPTIGRLSADSWPTDGRQILPEI